MSCRHSKKEEYFSTQLFDAKVDEELIQEGTGNWGERFALRIARAHINKIVTARLGRGLTIITIWWFRKKAVFACLATDLYFLIIKFYPEFSRQTVTGRGREEKGEDNVSLVGLHLVRSVLRSAPPPPPAAFVLCLTLPVMFIEGIQSPSRSLQLKTWKEKENLSQA